MPPPFEIAATHLPDVCWIQLRGELDHATAGRAEDALPRAHGGRGPLVIDTRALLFCDVRGFRVLAEAVRRARGDGRGAGVVASSSVARIAGLLDASDVLTDEDPAVLSGLAHPRPRAPVSTVRALQESAERAASAAELHMRSAAAHRRSAVLAEQAGRPRAAARFRARARDAEGRAARASASAVRHADAAAAGSV